MEYLNTLIKTVKQSETLAVKAKAAELKAQGKSVVDLSTGEPDFDTPDFIKEAAYKALREGKTKYTAVAGIPELRQAVAAKFQRENQIAATPETVIVTNGGKQAIHEAFEVCLNPGDEVIVPAPYWVSYPPMIELAGGKPVIVKTRGEDGYKLSPADLEKALTPRTRMVIINSPSNPTGGAYTKEELKDLSTLLKSRDILIMSDEVYEKIVYGDFKFHSFAQAVPELADRTITINAFSKTFSMTGWRIGYATGPKEIISAMGKFQGQTTSNISSFSQYAAIAALQGSQDFLKGVVAQYGARMRRAIEGLGTDSGLSVPVMPEGAFYLFIRIEDLVKRSKGKLSGSVETATRLIEQQGVAVVPGDAFGDDGAIRISVAAADDQVEEGIRRIVAFAKGMIA